MINVLIADDHQMVIDGMKALLSEEHDIQIVGEALNGDEALAFLKSGNLVDLIILDINMPNTDGIETARAIAHNYPATKVLILSMHNKPIYIKQLIEVGVSGYILKNAGKEELLSAIKNIQSGKEYFSSEVTKAIFNSLKNSPTSTESQLTKRELEILRLLSKALTTSEIAEKLFLSPYTVDTHRKNLLSKLGLRNTPALVRYAIEHGLSEDIP
ncbi:MAG TPA: response regulator transcription factor [Chryseolinea sp.]|nr:response regulator transcription factor [Chryseolinea sp.]